MTCRSCSDDGEELMTSINGNAKASDNSTVSSSSTEEEVAPAGPVTAAATPEEDSSSPCYASNPLYCEKSATDCSDADYEEEKQWWYERHVCRSSTEKEEVLILNMVWFENYIRIFLWIWRSKAFCHEYSHLGEVQGILTNATVLALTASAPPSIIPLLKKHLLLQKDTAHIIESANRKNGFLYS